jgi:hypothetical protein
MAKDSRTALPPRIAAKPDPASWPEDELLTLPEAAALCWPTGPLTTRSLRTAQRAGQLATVTIAGKMFTTRRALHEMARCRREASADPPHRTDGPSLSFDDLVKAKRAAKVLPPIK